MFWKDVPGATSPGHWLSILQQVMRQKGTSLDKAAFAYALTGTSINDALISCFKSKYQYDLVGPITYIRNVMGYSTWEPYIPAPSHPEYISAPSSLSGAAASVLQKLFDNIHSFTDHTYDYMGFTPRTYASFDAIAVEAGHSRLFAGIHYQQSIIAGLAQGKKVTENIFKNK
ncbi:MAG: vanadium-dependent haloperoxidase [Rhizobacter sp.]|nr:vanadium-dependent haloperoxidase [Ferruginibacter sp.]